jgi:hypothetical protein
MRYPVRACSLMGFRAVVGSVHHLYGFGLVALLFAGCASMSPASQARDAFSSDHTCPADRVTVTDRGAAPDPQPPEDVSKDPTRLKMWNEQHKVPPVELYNVDGCGAQVLYSCRAGTGVRGDTGLLQYTCVEARFADVLQAR